jgi:hypothetical protein
MYTCPIKNTKGIAPAEYCSATHSFMCKSKLALAKHLLQFASSMYKTGIKAVSGDVRAAILSNPTLLFDTN